VTNIVRITLVVQVLIQMPSTVPQCTLKDVFRLFLTRKNFSGQLMNTAFLYAHETANFDCYVFHDVDVIAEDDRILYGCRSKKIDFL